ncbi:MAG: hypothetical protein KR126chlam3_00790 [Chlamydiae bacterium]|nr:hypothetical protein [Chlamydiota bacterium]
MLEIKQSCLTFLERENRALDFCCDKFYDNVAVPTYKWCYQKYYVPNKDRIALCFSNFLKKIEGLCEDPFSSETLLSLRQTIEDFSFRMANPIPNKLSSTDFHQFLISILEQYKIYRYFSNTQQLLQRMNCILMNLFPQEAILNHVNKFIDLSRWKAKQQPQQKSFFHVFRQSSISVLSNFVISSFDFFCDRFFQHIIVPTFNRFYNTYFVPNQDRIFDCFLKYQKEMENFLEDPFSTDTLLFYGKKIENLSLWMAKQQPTEEPAFHFFRQSSISIGQHLYAYIKEVNRILQIPVSLRKFVKNLSIDTYFHQSAQAKGRFFVFLNGIRLQIKKVFLFIVDYIIRIADFIFQVILVSPQLEFFSYLHKILHDLRDKVHDRITDRALQVIQKQETLVRKGLVKNIREYLQDFMLKHVEDWEKLFNKDSEDFVDRMMVKGFELFNLFRDNKLLSKHPDIILKHVKDWAQSFDKDEILAKRMIVKAGLGLLGFLKAKKLLGDHPFFEKCIDEFFWKKLFQPNVWKKCVEPYLAEYYQAHNETFDPKKDNMFGFLSRYNSWYLFFPIKKANRFLKGIA